jgi:hypothetical protein
MGFKIENKSNELVDKTKQRSNIFMRTMLDRIINISTPRTPKREGYLSRGIIKRVQGTKGQIEWGTKYASVQEAGKRVDPRSGKTVVFRNYTTPGTGPHFAEKSIKEAIKGTGIVARLAHLI